MHILGKTLQMLNYRKQLPVHAYNGFINSTEDTRLLSELDQNGYSTDDIDLKFQETSILSTEDQNVQVCSQSCLLMKGNIKITELMHSNNSQNTILLCVLLFLLLLPKLIADKS